MQAHDRRTRAHLATTACHPTGEGGGSPWECLELSVGVYSIRPSFFSFWKKQLKLIL